MTKTVAAPRTYIWLLMVLVVGLLGWMAWKQVRPDSTAEALERTASDSARSGKNDMDSATGATNGTRPAAATLQAMMAKQLALMKDPAKAKQQRDQELAALEAQHRAEPVDSAWAAKTERALSDVATSEVMVGTKLTPRDYDADCRSATCRISASFDSSSDAQDWGGFLMTVSGAQLRQAKLMVVPGPDGSAEVRIFGARR